MIWPFNNKKSTDTDALPMPDAVYRQNSQVWRYTPQPNITAHDVALLLPVFIGRGVDGVGYLEKHNLLRHFTKIEE